jgi:hypothetical protein
VPRFASRSINPRTIRGRRPIQGRNGNGPEPRRSAGTTHGSSCPASVPLKRFPRRGRGHCQVATARERGSVCSRPRGRGAAAKEGAARSGTAPPTHQETLIRGVRKAPGDEVRRVRSAARSRLAYPAFPVEFSRNSRRKLALSKPLQCERTRGSVRPSQSVSPEPTS